MASKQKTESVQVEEQSSTTDVVDVVEEFAPRPPKVSYPAKIRVLRPHGFVDDNSKHHYWHAGTIVEDADEIQLLIDRGATIEAV